MQKVFRFGRHPVAMRIRITIYGKTLWLTKKKIKRPSK